MGHPRCLPPQAHDVEASTLTAPPPLSPISNVLSSSTAPLPHTLAPEHTPALVSPFQRPTYNWLTVSTSFSQPVSHAEFQELRLTVKVVWDMC